LCSAGWDWPQSRLPADVGCYSCAVVYIFDGLELDLDTYELKSDRGPLPIQRKVFDVLKTLVERRDAVVSKDELLEVHWPGEHVNEAAVAWTVSRARRAIEEGGGSPKLIETVRGRGYRFRGQVEERTARDQPTAPKAEVSVSLPPQALADTSPFVGRTDVLATLIEGLERALGGQGGFVTLRGEAGIGKSRCARELSTRAEGMYVLTGCCVEGGVAPPFWPVAQVLRTLMAQASDPIAERARTLITQLMPDGHDHEGDLQDGFLMADGVAQLLADASGEQPMLVILDDIQWADGGSLEALRLLALGLEGRPIMLLCTQREGTDAQATDARRLRRISRHAQSIALGPLGREEVQSWALQVQGGAVPAHVVDALARETAGNPLLVEHTLGLWSRRGPLDQLTARQMEDMPLAEGTRDVLRTRLEDMPEGTQAVLQRAAVLGVRFRIAQLAALCEGLTDACLSELQPALSDRVVLPDGAAAYAFCHGLMRDVVYGELAEAERLSLHAAAAEILHKANAPAVEIAQHLYLALPMSRAEQAVSQARLAARAAAVAGAYTEAARCLAWALAAFEQLADRDPRERAELLLQRATHMRRGGAVAEAREVTKALFELAREHRLPEFLLKGVGELRSTVTIGYQADPGRLAAIEDALELLPEDATALRSEALSQLATIPPHSLDKERSRALSAQALELAESLDEPRARLSPLLARLFVLSGPDDVEALLGCTDDLIATCQATGVLAPLMDVHLTRHSAFLMLGEPGRAGEALDAMGEVVRKLKHREAQMLVRRLRNNHNFHVGRFAEMERGLNEWLTEANRLGIGYADYFHRAAVTRLVILRDGGQVLRDVPVEEFENRHGRPVSATTRAAVAAIAAEAGKQDLARRLVEGLFQGERPKMTQTGDYLFVLCAIARACAELGDRKHGRLLLPLLLPYADRIAVDGLQLVMGSVAHYLGRLELLLGSDEGAREHLRQARTREQELGYLPRALLSGLVLYEHLQAAGGADDEARSMRGWLQEQASAIGMRWVLDRIA